MLIIRFVATRAVEAAPSRFVALRVLLIVTYGTPRFPPPARLRAPPSRRLPLQGGVILEACKRRLARFLGMM